MLKINIFSIFIYINYKVEPPTDLNLSSLLNEYSYFVGELFKGDLLIEAKSELNIEYILLV